MDLDMCEATDDVDDSGPRKPSPTPAEALQAIVLITNYIDSINDPAAWKLEGLRRGLSCQICMEQSRTMKERTTSIADKLSNLR